MTTSDTATLTNKLLTIINQVQQAVIAKAPVALNLVLASLRMDALGDFLSCVGMLFVIFIFWKIWNKIKHIKQVDYFDGQKEMHFGVLAYSVIASVISVILFALVIIVLFNIWEYVELFNPKLYLAHVIVNKLMNA